MKFSQFLNILNCYIGQEKTQLDFLYICFQQIMVSPYTEIDEELDANDNYYPFSKTSEKSTAKKICSGERSLSKGTARFVKGHFDGSNLISSIEEMDDIVKKNLCNDLEEHGIYCNIDSVGEMVSSLFFKFIEAAIEEKDNIDTGTYASAEIKSENILATNQDALLLLEVNNKCPLCGAPLMFLSSKGTNIKRYKITQIFPENIERELYITFSKHSNLQNKYNHPDNLIALCAECSIDYLSNPVKDDFIRLQKIKKSIQQRSKLRQSMDDIWLESEINDVVNGMININMSGEINELKMDAINIRKKIDTKNKLLIDAITDDVAHYYRYIEELFADIDSIKSGTFDQIALKVRLVYNKIKNSGLSQSEIYEHMSSWLKQNISIEHQNDMAINAVISFFVQNCEVFDEISK